MSLQKIAEYLFPAGNFAQIRATSPDQRTYNIDATRDLVQNQPAIFAPFAPVAAAGLSLPYDAIQAGTRITESDMDKALQSGALTPREIASEAFGLAYGREKPLSSAVQRTQGATLGLADRLKNVPGFLSDLIFTPVGTAEADKPPPPNYDTMTYLNELDDDQSRVLGERKNLLEIILGLAPIIGDEPLTGILTNAFGGTRNRLTNFRDAIGNRLGPASYGTSQAAFNAMTPSQQQAVGSIYGRGGIMQGYNPVSAFGRGPAGAIQNRIDAILGRKAPQTRISKQRVKDLQAALNQIDGAGSADSGSSFDSNTGGTFGSSIDDASTFSDYS